MTITSITLVQGGRGPDRIALNTTLPSPLVGEAFLTLDFTAPRGRGQDYIERNFPGVPVEVIGIPTHKYEFSK